MKTPAVLLAVVLALAISGCAKSHPPAATALPAVAVHVAPVTAEDLPVLTAVTGTVRPLQRAVVAAKVMGAIEQLPVTLGQHVAAGDLLARLAATDLAARVTQAQTTLAQARRDLDRDTRLATGGAATEDAVRISADRVALAEAALREAETTLGYATLRAPFAGVVTRRLAYAGDLASPGQPLLEIEGSDAFEIEVPIPDSLAATVALGSTLDVSLPAPATAFTASVTELSSAADSAARSVLVKLAVPAGASVRSGQAVRVLLLGTPARTLLIPASAVTTFGQMERVFVVTADRRASLRLVKTGAAHGERVEILAGLDAAENVILAPPVGLHDGQPLTFTP